MIVAEINLSEIARQMVFGTVLIHAFHASLENAEIALNRVRVDRCGVRGLQGIIPQNKTGGVVMSPPAQVL